VAAQANKEFRSCTNLGEREAVCPKGIELENVALMNRDFLLANLAGRVGVKATDGRAGGAIIQGRNSRPIGSHGAM
jgi:hypothetical protein